MIASFLIILKSIKLEDTVKSEKQSESGEKNRASIHRFRSSHLLCFSQSIIEKSNVREEDFMKLEIFCSKKICSE